MADDAQEFFDTIVEPALRDFRDAEDDLVRAYISKDEAWLNRARPVAMRRARNASIELHQFADRVTEVSPPWAAGMKPDDLRKFLMDNHCKRRPNDVLVLHDVADAFKHAKLHWPRKGGRAWFVRSDRAVISSTAGWGELGWGEGRWGGPEQIVIELVDGTKRSLLFVLDTVADAWRSAMGRAPKS